MASKFSENSHYEANSPGALVQGGRGGADQRTEHAMGTDRDDGSSVDHVQDKAPAAAPLSKKQKLKRHCVRFKWWYLIGTVILLAIGLPVLFLVIFPAIVQRLVDDQNLPIDGGSFIVLSPSQIMVSLDTSLNTPLPASLDALKLFLYNRPTSPYSPFLNVTIPTQRVNGPTKISLVNETVTITNETEIIDWFNVVFDEQTVPLSARGDTTVHLGALRANVHLDKTVTVNALDRLQGFSLEKLHLMLPPDSDGNNVKGAIMLPNWADLTLGLGDISLNLLSGDVRLGLITIPDVVLTPGNNTKDFIGQLFLDELIDNLGAILDTQAEALGQGNIQLNGTGNATIVDGKHIHFVEAVLNNKKVTASVSIIKLLGDVIGSLAGAGGTVSLTHLLGDVFDNSTLIEDILSHWNMSETAVDSKRKRFVPESRTVMERLSTFTFGMKMLMTSREDRA